MFYWIRRLSRLNFMKISLCQRYPRPHPRHSLASCSSLKESGRGPIKEWENLDSMKPWFYKTYLTYKITYSKLILSNIDVMKLLKYFYVRWFNENLIQLRQDNILLPLNQLNSWFNEIAIFKHFLYLVSNGTTLTQWNIDSV